MRSVRWPGLWPAGGWRDAELPVRDRVRRTLVQPAPPVEPRFGVPPGFGEWVAALLARDPGVRPRRAADVALALQGLGEAPEAGVASGPIQQVSASPATFLPRRARGPFPEPVGEPSPALRFERPPLPRRWEMELLPPRPLRLHDAGLGLFGVREPPVVGRVDERAALWEALRSVGEDGVARAVALVGSEGSGRSRLARWCAERAHEVGAAEVIRVSLAPGPVDRGAQELLCAALRVRPGASMPADTPEQVVALVQSPQAHSARVRRALATRAVADRGRGRVVVVVLQGATASGEAMDWVAGRVGRGLPILVLLTAGDAGEVPEGRRGARRGAAPGGRECAAGAPPAPAGAEPGGSGHPAGRRAPRSHGGPGGGRRAATGPGAGRGRLSAPSGRRPPAARPKRTSWRWWSRPSARRSWPSWRRRRFWVPMPTASC